MSLWGKEHGRSILDLLIEVALVSSGVFLALLANNWHENRQHRALARTTRQNFVEEMRTNERMMQEKRAYHVELGENLQKFLAQPDRNPRERLEDSIHFRGVQPRIFEHTAWDLALATQALQYMKPDVALAVSKVYTQQNSFQMLENNFNAAAYTTLANPDTTALATTMAGYMSDVNTQEPQLLGLYRKVLPQIETDR